MLKAHIKSEISLTLAKHHLFLISLICLVLTVLMKDNSLLFIGRQRKLPKAQ